MTTVACNRRMMVSDSKVTMEAATQDRTYQSQKIWKLKDGSLLGCAGSNDDIATFLKWYGTKKKKPRLNDFEGLVLTSKGVINVYDETCTKDSIVGAFYAIGSGGQAALGALFAGATLATAIEIACKVDPSSGLPLQVLGLDPAPSKAGGDTSSDT